ncbi:MAG: UDP-glucose 6-dehydrogenase, partial [Calditrichaeota bacterium]|nr:UDP-glucose 6-dehydrogenase [Calditrichota bacterium]
CDDNFDTLHDADGLVLVTEWLNYREPDFKQMKSMMRTPVIFDGRNVYNPQKMREIGFAYYGIGRR